MFSYRVSVIVPVFNKESFLARSVGSLLNQTIPSQELEILLIDDGSDDASPQLCDQFAQDFDNVFAIHKENGGLSDARNCGIRHAYGKYIMYLDADDFLQEDTIEVVTDFFEDHYNEVDLVTYPCKVVNNGEVTPMKHYRYRVFQESGIYSLTDGPAIYAAVTQMYVCVKNLGEDNVMFSSNRWFRHEDQKYCTDIILNKLRVGYCSKGAYLYDRQPDGLTSTYFHSYYLFENTMEFWEEEFSKFSDKVPEYLQALYVSDLSWKIDKDILLPYHYDNASYLKAVNRLDSLLLRVEASVIKNHPALDVFRAAFFLQRKQNCQIACYSGKNSLALIADGNIAYVRSKVEIILLRSIPISEGLIIVGFLKSPCFQFGGKPVLKAELVETAEDGSEIRTVSDVELNKSSWNYYHAKFETSSFWGFRYTMPCTRESRLEFFVHYLGETIQTNYYFMPRAIFSLDDPNRLQFVRGSIKYYFHRNVFYQYRLDKGELRATQRELEKGHWRNTKRLLSRSAARRMNKSGRRIWLYHDCKGVEKNNAYYQFIHDIKKQDGVERYYVVNDPIASKEHLFSKDQLKWVIPFRGQKHKLLFLSAELIITAYVEESNWMAFSPKGFTYFSDLFRAKIVYLQHGVLHSHMPWKYSLDRLLVDKMVVSTLFEVENLCEHYGFDRDHLILAGMPRYDYIDSSSVPKKKILYAPSWRDYLVQKSKDDWLANPSIFEESSFCKAIRDLIDSERLAQVLEEEDYELEIKLHPIFNDLYADAFVSTNPRIRIADSSVNEEEYAIFITDFSSYRFDFVYLQRSIIYFLPDEEEFRSGMCIFRETDLPLGGMFGEQVSTVPQLVESIESAIKRNGQPKPEYASQMNDFFLHYDNEQCKRVYQALSSEVEQEYGAIGFGETVSEERT